MVFQQYHYDSELSVLLEVALHTELDSCVCVGGPIPLLNINKRPIVVRGVIQWLNLTRVIPESNGRVVPTVFVFICIQAKQIAV